MRCWVRRKRCLYRPEPAGGRSWEAVEKPLTRRGPMWASAPTDRSENRATKETLWNTAKYACGGARSWTSAEAAFGFYDNEIDWYDDICPAGGIVDVIDSRHKFVARGYFNPRSKITVRILTRDADEVIDAAFFRRRIEAAWAFRRQLGFSDSCRVVFGGERRPAGPHRGQIRRLSLLPDRLPGHGAVEGHHRPNLDRPLRTAGHRGAQ